MDCNARGVSKWTGLSFLMNYFGLTPDEVCCFGDNLNDIEMLQTPAKATPSPRPSGSHRLSKTHLPAVLGERGAAGFENVFEGNDKPVLI